VSGSHVSDVISFQICLQKDATSTKPTVGSPEGFRLGCEAWRDLTAHDAVLENLHGHGGWFTLSEDETRSWHTVDGTVYPERLTKIKQKSL
jgi:hypothetical protein